MKKPAASGAPDVGKPGTRVKLVGLRRLIAEQMTRSKRTIPDYTFVEEVDLTELVRLRENIRQQYFKAGIKLTYLPFFVKAVCVALKEVPLINSTLDEINFADACTYAGRAPYSDPLYAGSIDTWTDCGGIGAIVFVLGVTPADGSYLARILIQAVEGRDLDAADQILATFVASP